MNTEIAKTNDKLSSQLIPTANFKVQMSPVVANSERLPEVLKGVRSFDEFNQDNDPYGEHDLGIFKVDGISYMFKIDYFDDEFKYGEDPYEKPTCNRLLFILEASEY